MCAVLTHMAATVMADAFLVFPREYWLDARWPHGKLPLASQ
jgi:hypothetical protein